MFRRRGKSPGDLREVTLAATVHVGDAEYYQGLQDECESNYDLVLFELITGEENLVEGEAPSLPVRPEDCGVPWGGERDESSSNDSWNRNNSSFLPRLKTQLQPTEDARNLAGVHGLRAQLDALNLLSPNWYVADIPKQELIKLQEEAGEQIIGSQSNTQTPTSEIPGIGAKAKSIYDRVGKSGNNKTGTSNGPLPPAVEAFVVAARGRAGGGPVKQLIRYLCWCVPCPEAHLLLLDWVWGGGRPAPVLGAMLDSLASGQIMSVRRLAFAQMIVSAQAKGSVGGGTEVPILVNKRNEKALECLRKSLDVDGVRRVALLYGGLHMPGLTSAMGSLDPGSGFKMEQSQIRWRPVWRVEAPKSNTAVRLLALPLLLFLDGTDWAATVTDSAAAFSQEFYFSSSAVLFLYVIRHGAVYYSLGKWVLEWNKQLFDGQIGEDGADGSDGLRST